MTRPRKAHEPYELPDGTRVLDWSDSSHYCPRSAPCRYCGNGTILLDSDRRPAHKVCAEKNNGR